MLSLASIVRNRLPKLIACLVLVGVLGNVAGRLQAQSRRFDVESYLKRIDTNGNGVLDENELSDRTKSFIERMGIETNRPVSISKVVEKINKDRNDQNKAETQKTANPLKVPGFGVSEAKTAAPIPGFQVSATSASGSSASAPQVSKEIEDRVNQTLERYDRNKNGVLDAEELKDARWGSPSPQESDTNRDGRLSRDELTNRYLSRSNYLDRSSQGRSQDTSTGNQDDRSRSARDRFRSSGDSGGGRSAFRSPSNGPGAPSSSAPRTSFRPSSSSSSSSGSSSDTDKFQKYADGLLKMYDKNGSNALEQDELAGMRRPPKADLNGDGTITRDELMDSLSGKATPSPAAAEKPVSADAAGEGSARRGRGSGGPGGGAGRASRGGGGSGGASFEKLDVNLDKRIHMHEFSSDWDQKTVDEFNAKDRNGDGVITISEWQAGG